jgi:hypothetical protein
LGGGDGMRVFAGLAFSKDWAAAFGLANCFTAGAFGAGFFVTADLLAFFIGSPFPYRRLKVTSSTHLRKYSVKALMVNSLMVISSSSARCLICR